MQNFDPQKNYYDILGLSEDASLEEIEKAYRTEARRHHPDTGGNEETMKDLNEARDLLSDQPTREAYDQARSKKKTMVGSSFAFDGEASFRGDAFKTVADDDGFSGSAILAATCLGIGIPLLFLVETQWVFFLWPLRIGGIGLVLFGIWMAQAALSARHRQLKKRGFKYSFGLMVLSQIIFWAFVLIILSMFILGFYRN
jgi:curved DNA-binding protein CbpA